MRYETGDVDIKTTPDGVCRGWRWKQEAEKEESTERKKKRLAVCHVDATARLGGARLDGARWDGSCCPACRLQEDQLSRVYRFRSMQMYREELQLILIVTVLHSCNWCVVRDDDPKSECCTSSGMSRQPCGCVGY